MWCRPIRGVALKVKAKMNFGYLHMSDETFDEFIKDMIGKPVKSDGETIGTVIEIAVLDTRTIEAIMEVEECEKLKS